MTKLKDSKEIIEKDTSTYVEDVPYLHFKKGSYEIASEAPGEIARLAKIYLKILALPNIRKVAVIGGGACILPRMLKGYEVDVYEIEREMTEEVSRRYEVTWNFIIGDWHGTLTGRYDVIVYDIGDGGESEITNSEIILT